ncbi:MAG: spore germination protein [Ectobacillus sp.]
MFFWKKRKKEQKIEQDSNVLEQKETVQQAHSPEEASASQNQGGGWEQAEDLVHMKSGKNQQAGGGDKKEQGANIQQKAVQQQPVPNSAKNEEKQKKQNKDNNRESDQSKFAFKKRKEAADSAAKQESVQKKRVIFGHSNALLREQMKQAMNDNPDLQMKTIFNNHEDITLFFIKGAVNEQTLNEDILEKILETQGISLTNEVLKEKIPITRMQVSNVLEDICESLMDGWVFIHINGQDKGVLFNLSQPQYRNLSQSMNEANVLGPKLEFTESLETNCQVLRQLIKNEDLIMESMTVGKRAPKELRIIYMKGIAEEENIQAFRDKISMLDVDDILDSSVLIQMIEENQLSLFPQLIMSEQPQRFAYAIMNGKVGILLNGSPMAVMGPVTFFNFFESTEDLYFRWGVSTFLRILRFFAMFISITFTPAYVAALSFHYEIIPSALLVSIGQSRSNVPFPPVMEAFLLEGLIELLREAGARLPTKVGQTIGIVGGIVIGQAAVQAGFTSNILIIVVALSALASFTAPNYEMGTVIRVLRFPLIILAGMAGGIGMMFGLCFILIHLLKVTSLNRPYLAPLYPFHLKDFGQNIIRLPHRYVRTRSSYNEPEDSKKRNVAGKKKKKDIDE